jgi:hypothetical protein
MGKIVAFVFCTIGLSLAILLPCYYFFGVMVNKVKQVGIFQEAIDFFWQGFAIIVFVVVVIVGTSIALIVWDSEKHVL